MTIYEVISPFNSLNYQQKLITKVTWYLKIEGALQIHLCVV